MADDQHKNRPGETVFSPSDQLISFLAEQQRLAEQQDPQLSSLPEEPKDTSVTSNSEEHSTQSQSTNSSLTSTNSALDQRMQAILERANLTAPQPVPTQLYPNQQQPIQHLESIGPTNPEQPQIADQRTVGRPLRFVEPTKIESTAQLPISSGLQITPSSELILPLEPDVSSASIAEPAPPVAKQHRRSLLNKVFTVVGIVVIVMAATVWGLTSTGYIDLSNFPSSTATLPDSTSQTEVDRATDTQMASQTIALGEALASCYNNTGIFEPCNSIDKLVTAQYYTNTVQHIDRTELKVSASGKAAMIYTLLLTDSRECQVGQGSKHYIVSFAGPDFASDGSFVLCTNSTPQFSDLMP